MNGPDHYRQAEALLELADSPAGRAMKADGYDATAEAQVHATLALAAATMDSAFMAASVALHVRYSEPLDDALNGWGEVTS